MATKLDIFPTKAQNMKKILLVEDDPFIIDIYKTKLESAGFLVDVALNGPEAIEKAEEHPDLILLDIVLPSVDGWEILRTLREDKKFGLNSIPVIILSNLGQKSEVEKGLKLGAKKYLIKANYTPSQIVDEIKNFLK